MFYAARLRNWLQVAPPPLPTTTDLDRSEDGTLDVRQHWYSGRFVSAKLEAAYAPYILNVWRPRLRSSFVFFTILEGCLLTKSLLCRCGLRFETYDGWALVYSFAFLMCSHVFMWLILSPKLTRVTSRMMPWLIPFMVVFLIMGYTIPLGAYLDGATNNVSLPEDAAAMQLMQLSLVDQGAWFTTSITTYTLLFSLASVTFGVGAFTFVLGMPAAIFFYLLFERKRFGHQYGIEPSLVPQSLIVYAICTILTFWIKGSTRQQFLVRIYVQHERDARVEQLEQEKERLDYERRFALQNPHGALPPRGATLLQPPRGATLHEPEAAGDDEPSAHEGTAEARQQQMMLICRQLRMPDEQIEHMMATLQNTQQQYELHISAELRAVQSEGTPRSGSASSVSSSRGGGLALDFGIGLPFGPSSKAGSAKSASGGSHISEPEFASLGDAPLTATPRESAEGRSHHEPRSHQNASPVGSDSSHVLSQVLWRTLDFKSWHPSQGRAPRLAPRGQEEEVTV